ncbi:MAG TPA: hypothetical protein VF294_02130 [Polyangiaceae bacterium]
MSAKSLGFWCGLSWLALTSGGCGARSALELLDASTSGGNGIITAGGGNSTGGSSTGGSSTGGSSTGGSSTGGSSTGGVRGIVACPPPGSPDEAYDAISGSPCDEPDDFSCRGSAACSRVCNCFPPPNNKCESSAVPVWECDPFNACERPIGCPLEGAVEIAYNSLSGSHCATEGAACGYCTCERGDGSLTWACSSPSCY